MLVKYPRTPHLPYSPGCSDDDVVLETAKFFEGKEVVVLEKMDGENTTMYNDHVHARSVDSVHHPSRTWVKQCQAMIAGDIPKSWRICGENVQAYHSILYTDLPAYFLVFSIYNENNFCISWDETQQFCDLLDLHTVPVLYRGIYDEEKIRSLWTGNGYYPTLFSPKEYPKSIEEFAPTTAEGYVIRLAKGFHFEDFGQSIGKYVRKNHVQTTGMWMTKPVFNNFLKEKI